ncbi:unnamed protein product, partial [Lymnaea stagnalis]
HSISQLFCVKRILYYRTDMAIAIKCLSLLTLLAAAVVLSNGAALAKRELGATQEPDDNDWSQVPNEWWEEVVKQAAEDSDYDSGTYAWQPATDPEDSEESQEFKKSVERSTDIFVQVNDNDVNDEDRGVDDTDDDEADDSQDRAFLESGDDLSDGSEDKYDGQEYYEQLDSEDSYADLEYYEEEDSEDRYDELEYNEDDDSEDSYADPEYYEEEDSEDRYDELEYNED